MKYWIQSLTLLVIFCVFALEAIAQCPMCKAAVESADTGPQAASSLNAGILYLFALPYLGIGLIGFLWYRRRQRFVAEQVEGDEL